jgi:hypothetical protein
MKVVILYHSQSDQERPVLDYERDYEAVTGRKLTLCDVDTVEGAAMATLYDIVSYPAVLAMTNDGSLLQMWQGEVLPMINEVNYYDQPE